jgi:3',5'-cyclic AMP phosphodiesterase CpdA
MRVILVSDTHLSPAVPQARANWDAVLRYVDANAPDAVIHLGDLSLDGARDPGDLRYGRRQLDRLPVPWYAVPGNHDVGDNPWPGAPADSPVRDSRCQQWLDIIGADRWALTASGWMLLAINAQLFGSGLEAEARQWAWLGDQLSGHRDGRPTALITHKPVTASDGELAGSPAYRFLARPARDRLRGLLGGTPLALVLSGHVHQYRLLYLGGTDHLWVPTTWAVLPDQVQPVLGTKRCGIVSIDLASGRPPAPALVEPDGIVQLTVGTGDMPDPYHR